MPEIFTLDITVAVGIGVGIAVLLLTVGLLGVMQRTTQQEDRLLGYAAFGTAILSEEAHGVLGDLEEGLRRTGIGRGIARKLARADIKLTVVEYALLAAGLVAAGFFLGALLLQSSMAALVLAVMALLLLQVYVDMVQHKRTQAFTEQLPNTLSSLANALRGGYAMVQGMSMVANDSQPPMSVELERVVAEIGYGLSPDVAFQNMLRRNPSEDLNLVVTAIEINMEMGGNLAAIIDSTANIIRDRVRIQGHIRSLTAQQRLSATLLTVLPFFMMGLMYMTNRAYASLLWTTTAGWIMLGIAGTMLLTGTMLLRRVAQIRV